MGLPWPENIVTRRFDLRIALLFGLTLSAVPARAQTVEDLRISVPGTGQSLAGRLCRPAGQGPATLVVIAHGSPPDAASRPGMALHDCGDEAAQWFLTRGYAVAFALRRGYGATGGAWAENYGACGRPDFVRAGLETARDIDATVAAVIALPGVRPTGAVVVGQSAGGWGTLAYASRAHRRVAALVAIAPGRGGHEGGQANSNCAPEALAAAAGRFGRTARTPILWIDGTADTYFDPALSQALYQAFASAGGRAQFVQPAGAGHGLFFSSGGSATWGPLIEAYLAQQRVGP